MAALDLSARMVIRKGAHPEKAHVRNWPIST